MQVGASPADRIINHVQVKCTALPGAELQQCLCRAACHPLGQGNAHCRAVLSCPYGCKNREAPSQAASRVLGTPRQCSHSHVPAWFLKSWFYRKFTFIVCHFFLFNVSCFAMSLEELGFLMRKTCVRESELPASTSILRDLGQKL